MESVANLLLNYLNNVIKDPEKAHLEIQDLPEELQELGERLIYLTQCIKETSSLAKAMAIGNLNVKLPPPDNEMASSLKSLHASLRHLTWQTQQVAKGDYGQKVDFMGEFSEAFNSMTSQLEKQRESLLEQIKIGYNRTEYLEKSNNLFKDAAYTDTLTGTFNRRYGMEALNDWLDTGISFVLCFVDIDNLKCMNDKFGHSQGDSYIIQVAEDLSSFSSESILCRIGGDEFMILAKGLSDYEAIRRMEGLRNNMINSNFEERPFFIHSISYGIIEVSGDAKMSASDILSIADDRMYEYKREHKKRKIPEID